MDLILISGSAIAFYVAFCHDTKFLDILFYRLRIVSARWIYFALLPFEDFYSGLLVVEMRKQGRAVVMGGSLAGLFCARVLSNHFDKVTVVERDTPRDDAAPRKGAPQGAHAHVLLKRGEHAMEALFPGLSKELVDGGAHPCDWARGVDWFHYGCWKVDCDSKLPVTFQSRPFLEQLVRNRLANLDKVHLCYGAKVTGLVITDGAVTGLNIEGAEGAATLATDFVVDASGRGSKLPEWLEAHGYRRPRETEINIGLGYVSRMFQAPKDFDHDWTAMIIYPHAPDEQRVGGIFPMENGRWMVTLGSYGGVKLPTDHDGFMNFARNLSNPALYEAIKQATPLTDAKVFRYDIQRRRHYEAAHLPAGLLVLGDAACSFDPVFGQGMSTAAAESVILEKCLAQKGYNSAMIRLYFRRISCLIDVPWLLVTNEAFRYPSTIGKKPFGLGLLQWYTGQVFRLSAGNAFVYANFLKVMHLIASPIILFRPGILLPVLGSLFKTPATGSRRVRQSGRSNA